MAKIETTTDVSLTSTQIEVLEIANILSEFNFALLGHGTPSDDASSFFTKGVLAGSYDDVLSIAIPLDATNINSIDNWPHKKYSQLPNIVLLGVPNPSPEQGVVFSQLTTHVLEEDATGHSILPSKYVFGFYNALDQCLVINPDFDLSKDSYTEAIHDIGKRILAVPVGLAHIRSSGQPDSVQTNPNKAESSSNDLPDVW